VELIRSILKCTGHHVIVLSERNGAIDAIAEKIAEDCIDHKHGDSIKKAKVRDVHLWSSVVAFGSSGVGPSTNLFLPEEKLRLVSCIS